MQYWDSLRSYADTTLFPLVPPAVTSALNRSTSPRSSPPPDTSFRPLPSELVLHILYYTLPEASCTNHAARCRLLKSYALFSPDCARWAALELRRDVRLETFEQAKWLVRNPLRQHGRSWATGVRVMRLGYAGETQAHGDAMWRADGVGHLVKDLLGLCENVEELWLSGLSGLEVGDLSAGTNVRRLSFNECRVTPSMTAPTILLPRLSTLYLKAVIFTGHALHQLLQPSTLPSLRHLDYISVHQSLVSPMPGSLAATAAAPAAGPPGSTALASITASLAALAPQTRAAHPSSPPSSTASDHPLLAFAPTLVTLSLGSHASRTMSGRALVSFVEHAERLAGLCLPAGMFLEVGGLTDALAAGAPRLRAIRLTGKERALGAVQAQQQQRAQRNVGTWRSTAFDLLAQAMTTAESEAVDLGVAEQRQREVAARDARRVEQAVQRVLGVFERLGTLSKGEKERILSVPAQEDAEDEFKEEVVFSRFAPDESSGMLARIEHEPLEPCDGAWRLGTSRWRERVRLEEE